MRDYAELYSVLVSDIGIERGRFITSDLTVEEARRVSLANSFLKKLEPDEGDDAADEAALAKFIACNDTCAVHNLVSSSNIDDYIIGEVVAFFDNLYHCGQTWDLDGISKGFGVGPGVSIGADDENFFTKVFNSPLTATSSHLKAWYQASISNNLWWCIADVKRQTTYGDEIVQGSRLSFVPKTSEISRTICTEPTCNMLFQKGIGSILERFLKREYAIDLSTQADINKRLARIGSVDGSFGTIDLSSASDTISLKVLEKILPNEMFGWLRQTRSPVTTLPNGEVIELHMVSSMGNGYTFPLQTCIFLSIVIAVYKLKGIRPLKATTDRLPNFGVFGDDIIVRSDAYDAVVNALRLFGFTVNDDKSFNSGHFRESCGGDYYRGYDVRGVYLRRMEGLADVFSLFNRLSRWSSRSGIDLRRTLVYLHDSVAPTARYYVPYALSDSAGFKMSKSLAVSMYHQTRLQLATRPKHLRSETFKFYAYLDPEIRTVKWDKRGMKIVTGNDTGAMISFIGGFVEQKGYSLRSRDPGNSYKVRTRSTEFWYDRPAADLDAVLRATSHVNRPWFKTEPDPEDNWEVVFAAALLTEGDPG